MIAKSKKSTALSYALLSETTTMLADFIAQGRAVEPINAIQTISSVPDETLRLLAAFMRRHAGEDFVAGKFSTIGEFVFAVANARAHLSDPSSPMRANRTRARLLNDFERFGLYPGA